jgi:hypothetical protein
VPKFELYKHNDEFFNMYYRIFYELWTFADFDWLCKLEKREPVWHNFERDPPRDHPCQVWFNLVQRFQRRFKCDLLSKYA